MWRILDLPLDMYICSIYNKMMFSIKEPLGFIWDKGNKDKNWIKHKVINSECEEVLFDKNKKIFKDKLHSGKEDRFIVLGKTKKQRLLFIVFTIRDRKIRIISARNLDRKEKKII